MKQKHKIIVMILFLTILMVCGSWYGHINATHYKITDIRESVTNQTAREDNVKDVNSNKSYYYEQKITYKVTRTKIPFFYKFEIVTDTGRQYFSR